METRPFGKTGERFPILSFGAQRIVDDHDCSEEQAVAIFNRAIAVASAISIHPRAAREYRHCRVFEHGRVGERSARSRKFFTLERLRKARVLAGGAANGNAAEHALESQRMGQPDRLEFAPVAPLNREQQLRGNLAVLRRRLVGAELAFQRIIC